METKEVLFGLLGIGRKCLPYLIPLPAYAIGEIFKLETSGTQYRGDFDVLKFNPVTRRNGI